MDIKSIIQAVYTLPDGSLKKLQKQLSMVNYPKGYHLFHADKTETDVYFIAFGIARAYCYTAETEVTFWFGKEGDIVLSYNSYIRNQPGYEFIELLEDSTLFHLKTSALHQLFNEDIHLANWGRKLAELELIKTEARLISRQFRPAGERYRELLEQQPELVQRVQLSHIASYLGVTQVTLSRIRAEIR
ncbi:Crp/Fnr family transcriptional regulator [Solitalea lacus]|uniref:Crp/Fnr family transcriptional regulator n=1 Tax=Solitalea lacus TaxID=2911172 RepID=UPI001EDBB11F|nr:Crp/Fnr family transcriptional regulator [Solitalea lacus]UKJ07974.1 Crp/Fnr family transcriptional regulator [Solitalea lacus]